VELAVVRCRVHVLENTYVDRSGTGVGNRIEVYQQRMAVEVYLEMAVILGVLLLVDIRLPQGIGEKEPQLVNAWVDWDVVTKLPLRLRDRQIGGDGFPHGSKRALIGHRGEEMPRTRLGNASFVVTVSLPAVPKYVHIRSSRMTGSDTDFAAAGGEPDRLAPR